MRVLVFHGYLLRGTGSNVYNASLAQALSRLGHEVHLLCQDRDAAQLDFVDAVGRWRGGRLEVDVVREPVRCTAYLPDIGETLPVYVADRYEGFDARPLTELDDAAVERYVAANVAAVREVAERVRPDVALANHLVLGPAILARALGDVPYAVKIHGSALEYTVRRQPERYLPWAREGLAGASAVLAGSRHVAERLWALLEDPALAARTRLAPPGVDVERFRPREPGEAAAELGALADRLAGPAAGWGGEEGAAAALRELDPRAAPIVTYVGKLIVSKGVDLLIAAWPLVAERVPGARLCIVGFGTYREPLARLRDALAAGDVAAARSLAARGRELEGGEPGELRLLAGFLDGLAGERRARYLASAAASLPQVLFTGRLEHGDLPPLLAAAQAQVVPSTFPEAFGMVAAEAAACGALPVCAAHSGLAEVVAALAPALEPDLRDLLGMPLGDGVQGIAERLVRWLTLDPARRAAARSALAAAAAERYGWEGVARGVLAAAGGRLDALPAAAPAGAASSGASG